MQLASRHIHIAIDVGMRELKLSFASRSDIALKKEKIDKQADSAAGLVRRGRFDIDREFRIPPVPHLLRARLENRCAHIASITISIMQEQCNHMPRDEGSGRTRPIELTGDQTRSGGGR